MQLTGPSRIGEILMPYASDKSPVEVTWPEDGSIYRTYDDGTRELITQRLRGRVRIGWGALPPSVAAALVWRLQQTPVAVVPRTRAEGDPSYIEEVHLSCRVVSGLPSTAALRTGTFPVETELETMRTYAAVPGLLEPPAISHRYSFRRASSAYDLSMLPLALDEPARVPLRQSLNAFSWDGSLPAPESGPALSYTETVSAAKEIASQYPTAEYEDLCASYGALASGRELPTLRVGDDGKKPVLLVQTGVHGPEVAPVRGAEAFIRRYLTSTDPLMEWARENLSIWWIASANPDGHALGERFNANGVNLNRQWDYFWEEHPDPISEKGTGPLSESETGNVHDWLTSRGGVERVISAVDMHGWESRDDFGFLTDQYVGPGAYENLRSSYLYAKRAVEGRNLLAYGFDAAAATQDLVERKSKRNPYLVYWLHTQKESRSDYWGGLFEYPIAGGDEAGAVAAFDFLTGLVAGARETTSDIDQGVLVEPAVAPGDIMNNNSLLTTWYASKGRPNWTSSERLELAQIEHEENDPESTGVRLTRPRHAYWPLELNGAAGGVVDGQFLITAGGEDSNYERHFVFIEPLSGENRPPRYASSLPERSKHAAMAVDQAAQRIYYYGGYGGSSGIDYQDVLYSIAADGLDGSQAWTTEGNYMPPGEPTGPQEGLQRHTMHWWNGKLLIVGGRTRDGYLTTVWTLDPATGTTTTVANLPFPRGWHAAEVIGDTLWVMGGWNGSPQTEVFKVDLAAGTSTTHSHLPHERRKCGSFVRDGVIHVLGGDDGTDPRDEILSFEPGVDAAFGAQALDYDTYEDEHGQEQQIPPLYRSSPVVLFDAGGDQAFVIGGNFGHAADYTIASSVYEIEMDTLFTAKRETNDSMWGYIRPSQKFDVVAGERYGLTAAVQYDDAQERRSPYVRPTIYTGPLSDIQRKERLSYNIPPKGPRYTYAMPMQVAEGETELRAYLRLYTSGISLDLYALQLLRLTGGPVGSVVPEEGKAAGLLKVHFPPVQADTEGEARGAVSPLMGSAQPFESELLAFDVEGALDLLRLRFSSGQPPAPADGSDYDVQGGFELTWQVGGQSGSHIFDSLALNHDRFQPHWRRDVVHWKLRSEGDGGLYFHLWFYGAEQVVRIPVAAGGSVSGWRAEGSSAVYQVPPQQQHTSSLSDSSSLDSLNMIRLSTTDQSERNTSGFTPITWDAAAVSRGTNLYFDPQNPTVLTVKKDGVYQIHAHAAFTGLVERSNVAMQVHRNGVPVGPVGQSSYIRNSGVGDQESSSSAQVMLELVAGDTLSVQTKAKAASGSVTLEGGSGTLFEALRLGD